MSKYTDVALEEIRDDYPTAYEILKGAIKPEYDPYCKETSIGADCCSLSVRLVNNPSEIIINSPEIIEIFGRTSNLPSEGILHIGGVKFRLINTVQLDVSDHTVKFMIEKLEKE